MEDLREVGPEMPVRESEMSKFASRFRKFGNFFGAIGMIFFSKGNHRRNLVISL